MTTEQIISLIISISPSIIAILTAVGVVLRVLKDFRDLKQEVKHMKNAEDLYDKLSLVVQENYELKKALRETLTKIDHIQRK